MKTIGGLFFLTAVVFLTACQNPLGPEGSSIVKGGIENPVSSVPELSFLGSFGTTGFINTPMTIVPSLLNEHGSSLRNCTSSPSLPAGLSIDPLNCIISGTPSVPSSGYYVVTAKNGVGDSAPATVSITILAGALAPSLSYSGASGTSGNVGVSMSISPTTLTNNGSAITGCSSSPALSSGLSIDSSTCVISGTPSSVLSATSYTVTVTNGVGSSSANVSLTISASAPSLSYSGASGTSGSVGVNMSISPTTLTNNGSAITGCSSSPALPSGLSINSSTCVISGTPSSVLSTTSYTITATNSAGSSSANVSLTISASAPSLSYSGASGTSGSVGVNMSISPTTLANNGSAITGCSSSPALPSGLSINPSTCVISGTPSSVLSTTSYTVTVTNGVGSSSSNVSLTISASAPSLSYSGASGTSGSVGVGMSVTPTTLSNNGSSITGCSSSPALPSGLSINSSTCVISGTPNVALSTTSYTITVTNSVGSSSANVSLTISAAAPSLSYSGASGTSGNVGVSMSVTPTIFSHNGSSITGCSSSPALPSGLSVNPSTCVISGTPSSVLSSTSYTITATNSLGSSSANVSLTVSPSTPSLSYSGASGTSGSVGVNMSISPTTLTSNGSAITGCSSSPALPSGLSINSSTCVISGTPNGALSATAYTITATNGAGSSGAGVSLEIVLTCPSNYIPVPYNSQVGTTRDFCVAKYEMKNVGGVAASQSSGTPWVNISFTNSIARCSGLGSRYHLILNSEWMTIARNVELVGSNWSSGTAGSGVLARGHSDGSSGASGVLAASTDNDPYSGTGNNAAQMPNSGWEQRRTLNLSNGEVIWDFSANAWEWVNWFVTNTKKPYQNSMTPDAWREWRYMDKMIGENSDDEVVPSTWASSFIVFSGTIPDANLSLGSANGLGNIYSGPQGTGGYARRGGGPSSVANGGVFSLSLDNVTTGGGNASFRCTYTP